MCGWSAVFFIGLPTVWFVVCVVVAFLLIRKQNKTIIREWHDRPLALGASPMKISCVVVCVNYADFLAWTLPTDKQHFDRMVVVTSTADKLTQKLCEFWHVQCVVTDVCFENGAKFNKGKMINAGLAVLDGDGWVVHKDADIFLPPQFRRIVESLELDPEALYAIDRLMCDDFVEWLRHWYSPVVSNENDIYVHLKAFPVGTRIASTAANYGGWCPIGFFQMWRQDIRKLTYPTEHTDAGRSDMLFSLNFPRKKRQMLAEIVAIHLATKLPTGKMGANWNGRTTPPFGQEVLGEDFLKIQSSPVVSMTEEYHVPI